MTIVVRRSTLADAAAIARIMGDEAVYPGTMQMPFANEEAHRARLAEMLAPGRHDLLLTAELDGTVAGSLGLHPVGAQLRRRHVMTFGITVAPEAGGRGVGAALMQAMCDYADGWAGALRLELTVFADNDVAVRLYRRFGFEIEGRLRGYVLRGGRYVDAFAMARLHPDPPAIALAALAAPGGDATATTVAESGNRS